MPILIPVIILFAIGLLCALLLTLSSIFFGIKENETAAAIRDCLPGANCGACGYSGCDSYAQALSQGQTTKTNLCIPGGDGTAAQIANILQVEAEDVIEKVAFVACNGVCDAAEIKYDYKGLKTCTSASLSYKGEKSCNYACLGYGDCVKACPQNAITVENGVAKVDSRLCIGCGICARQCPNGVIKLINATSNPVVACSNHDKGALTRKACTNGCIGCKKCEKTCPNGAIKVENDLAVIDYSLCTSCGECVKACPVHCIHESHFTCGV